ncbi:PREDICTED: IGF-like family receptor 1 isoform X1 [Cyprinodon variegatus]|uniref:IGF-like family receptor 1 isoform X1 n=1 Tax=Cyprinodon variegatus TaxID=28743 RepID=UPI000742B25B|nr:PREDICTED: IGF-like family receptor 1 isoform X1 [Cyprinodon variegatus]
MVSQRCIDETTYFNQETRTCIPCERKAGFEVYPNCGRSDDGGVHSDTFRECPSNTFNDGTFDKCRTCSPCPIGLFELKPCNSTSDTVCQEESRSTAATLSDPATTFAPSSSTAAATQKYSTHSLPEGGSVPNAALWAVPITIIVFIMLAAAICALKMKKKRGLCKSVFYRRRMSYKNEGFSPISSSGTNTEALEDILNSQILSAPLHAVLDDLDVLEELVILLDPDTQGIKSTKHLASHCSFPSTWITYTYSMKDSKSPLKAVLEAVTSKQPDWTVGHLANLLRQMGRNDAITVLAKLRPGSNVGYI